jgi:DNA-binding transcriptional MerR regulator
MKRDRSGSRNVERLNGSRRRYSAAQCRGLPQEGRTAGLLAAVDEGKRRRHLRQRVSVQTLRHYDALGLLVPSESSVAGHRRYSEKDCDRLRLIRTLREVGFNLRSIRDLPDGRAEADAAFQILAEALEAEQRTLKRRQLLLRAALKGSRKNVLGRLHRKHVLAKRQLELSRGLDESKTLELGQTFQRLMADVMQALREQRAPDDDASRALVNEWIANFARLHARAPDAQFVSWLLDRLGTTDDPRINRYWELLSKIKRFPYDPIAARAHAWLRDALRHGAAARS